MKKLLAFLAGALLFAAPAMATTYNVANDGQLTTALNALNPGDVVVLANNNYTVAPNPGQDGTISQRITFVGNLTTPTAVKVPSPLNNGSRAKWHYITWKGVEMKSGFSLNGDVNHFGESTGGMIGDSLYRCYIDGSSGMQGATNCTIAACWIGYGVPYAAFEVSSPFLGQYTQSPSGLVIQDNNIRLHGDAATSDNVFQFQTIDFSLPMTGIDFERNHCTVTITGSSCGSPAPDTHFFEYLGFKAGTSADNYLYAFDSTTGTCANKRYIGHIYRDGTTDNYFTRDTLIDDGLAGCALRLNQTSGGTTFESARRNHWTGGLWKNLTNALTAGAHTDGIWFQAWPCEDVYSRQSFITGPNAGKTFIPGLNGAFVTFDHCNFDAQGSTNGALSVTATPGTQLNLSNSIFRTGNTTNPATSEALDLIKPANSMVAENNNLFANYTNAAHNIRLTVNGGTPFYSTGVASDVYGSPMWDGNAGADSAVATYNGTLGATSAAINKGTFGTSIGAVEHGTTTDVTPPGAITDLTAYGATSSNITLVWTTTGDDANSGTGSFYDLRYSKSVINSGNFTSATNIGVGIKPAISGTVQGISIGGFESATAYYFAIKLYDDVNLPSAISNVVVAGTTRRVNNGNDMDP